ncbi:MAG: 1,6-anhydro-N-acetylmuramyl-L-alanine amidase AmpD [Gammaproteobacteria bacterium]|nr:1,6-anhydro-N-acetylmuramyl-L-alanine amidase AmpD [Gammaproteobacteria bacterium]
MNTDFIIGHRLVGVPQRQTPHQDARPDPRDLSLLVVHGISLPPGEFGGPWIDALFLGCLPQDEHEYFKEISGLKVSAHLVIFRDGSMKQFAAFDRRAWHAGQSEYEGRSCCNDFAIGIELEGTDDQPYTDAQYRQLVTVSGALMASYPGLTPDRIVGHCDIAPGRKTDPGPAFDWPRFRRELEAAGTGFVAD